jgi:hypothetical protein
MTKPFAAHAFSLPGGSAITGGSDPPTFLGVDAQIGSYYICDIDGSWWKKTGPGIFDWVELRTITAANGDSVSLIPGMPVAASGDMIVRARADMDALSVVLGVVMVGADPTLPAQYLPWDLAALTQDEWNQVTGGISGLTPGAGYYLALAPGMMTTTPPSLSGTYVSEIGRAISSTTMIVRPRPRIQL